MRALDIIVKKRGGAELSAAEIHFLISGYVAGTIPEYQISAFLMAVYFQGMTAAETAVLTDEMIKSGDVIDLSSLTGPFVDKHSTGGVGDKVSLILAPMVAACGVHVPMMSGRSLGHTGGTLDKLESIPGYRTGLDPAEFARIIGAGGFAMTGQSSRVVPADRKLYALRDVTGTVESIPLITGSILSKKFAEGADALIFDVKAGCGAFMKTHAEARALADSLVRTGKSLGKKVAAVITAMDVPLGAKIGNFLEVEESLALLRVPEALDRVPVGELAADLMKVTLRLGGWMLLAAGVVDSVEAGEARCQAALDDGSAARRFLDNVRRQGGDVSAMLAAIGRLRAPLSRDLCAPKAGILQTMDAYKVGMAAVYLGAGRSKADDLVHPDVGIELFCKPGAPVTAETVIARLWGHDQHALDQATAAVSDALSVGNSPVPPAALILEELSAL